MSVSKHHKTLDSKCLNADALNDWQSAYLIESDKPVWSWISNEGKNLYKNGIFYIQKIKTSNAEGHNNENIHFSTKILY